MPEDTMTLSKGAEKTARQIRTQSRSTRKPAEGKVRTSGHSTRLEKVQEGRGSRRGRGKCFH